MMNNKRCLPVASLALGVLLFGSVARAKEDFPSQIRGDLGLPYDIPCSVCHIKGNVGKATPITPFAFAMRARGLTGERTSIAAALAKVDSDAVDSDGDGITDIAELKAGTDPNSSANASIENDQEPGYGCGGTAPHGRTGPAMGSVLALAWFVLRRRRGLS